MYIDTHVHLRDFNQSYKETIRHGLEVARDSGIDAVFDMPNTDPPITTEDVVLRRLALAKDADVKEVFYGIYMGLTADTEQIKYAIDAYRKTPQVIGFKLYAGHSVGNLGVVEIEDQMLVYNTLAKEGYDGILAVHCEKESEMNKTTFNPNLPITHCYSRPEISEYESLNDQIILAKEHKFKGKLHIPHISSPYAVSIINESKHELDVSCAVTPHHIIYDWRQMAVNNGILWKMNPPLRSPTSRNTMLEYLKQGKIDWIETDHAPHLLDEKTGIPYLSGIPGLPWWPLFEEFLRYNDFSERQIADLTFYNAQKRFDIDIERTNRNKTDRRSDYPFNPYELVDELFL